MKKLSNPWSKQAQGFFMQAGAEGGRKATPWLAQKAYGTGHVVVFHAPFLFEVNR